MWKNIWRWKVLFYKYKFCQIDFKIPDMNNDELKRVKSMTQYYTVSLTYIHLTVIRYLVLKLYPYADI